MGIECLSVEEDFECNFSSHLNHNKDVYNIVDELQRNEIKLLEQIESYFSKKVHIDQEYADKLSRLHQKFPAESLVFLTDGSQVNKAWIMIMEDSKKKIQTLLDSVKSILHTILPNIKALLTRKKQTVDSFGSRSNDLKRSLRDFDDEVKRLEGTYKDNSKDVAKSRKKMDEVLSKSKGGKDYAKFKEHLDNASRKLHMNHNEYVLAISAFNEYEKLFRNKLSKAYLKTVQDTQELYVEAWKDIYVGLSTQTCWCTETNVTSENGVKTYIDQLDPGGEYIPFVEEHSSPSSCFIPYMFLPSLLEDLQEAGLTADTLSLNDLTHEQLDYKKRSYEKEQEDLDERIREKQTNYDEESSSLNEMMERGTRNAQLSTIEQYVACMEVKGRLRDLECRKVLSKYMTDLITTTLASVAHSGIPPYETHPFGTDRTDKFSTKNKSKSLNAMSKMKDSSAAAQITQALSLQHKSFDNSTGIVTSKKLPPIPDKPLIKSKPRGASDPDLPSCAAVSVRDGPLANHTLLTNTASQIPPTQLELCSWYHGKIDRNAVAAHLQQDGDFLVREKQDGSGLNVLSLYWNGSVRHFILKAEQGIYKLESEGFLDIPSLINYHYLNAVIVTSASGAMLYTPITNCQEFLHSDIVLRAKLGSGNFGDVFQGDLVYNKMQVAVKTCKENADDMTKKIFLNEAGIMRPCDHPNVLRLIGISKDIEPFYIILELCSKKDLIKVLQREGNRLGVADLYKFSAGAASGMEYLESLQIIHRDLAARNCLVSADYAVKISDFGMSREHDEDGIYSMVETKIIPIKWSAPEVWNKKVYSSKSDVWSYGILLWEIFSKGGMPYTGWDNRTTSMQVDKGYRLPPPNGTPPQISALMEHCWQTDPQSRPDFSYLVQRLYQLGSLLG